MRTGKKITQELTSSQDFFRSLQTQRRHFLILGLGKTGFSLVTLFCQEKITFSIVERKKTSNTKNKLKKIFNQYHHVAKKTLWENPTPQDFQGITDILISPGIPRKSNFLKPAIKKKIPIWNDVDFFYPLFKHFKIIGVTGTDGKTSTVALLEHLLKPHFDQVLSGGNNGIPIADLIGHFNNKKNGKILILEFSSYMLEVIYQFRADFSVVLNLADDHLDRYNSLKDYAHSKYNLLRYLTTKDTFLINLDNPITANYLIENPKKNHFKTITIGEKRKNKNQQNPDYSYDQRGLYLKKNIKITSRNQESDRFSTHPINILTSLVLCQELGVDLKGIEKELSTFHAPPHRLELITDKFSPFQIYNDSKATTLQSVVSAIISFDRPVKLILGGKNKNISFSDLSKYRSSIKHFYFYGEAGKEIKNHLKQEGFYQYRFQSVVKKALKELQPNEILLLSPGCSSLDQFKNFEERGEVFKSLCRDWQQKNSLV